MWLHFYQPRTSSPDQRMQCIVTACYSTAPGTTTELQPNCISPACAQHRKSDLQHHNATCSHSHGSKLQSITGIYHHCHMTASLLLQHSTAQHSRKELCTRWYKPSTTRQCRAKACWAPMYLCCDSTSESIASIGNSQTENTNHVLLICSGALGTFSAQRWLQPTLVGVKSVHRGTINPFLIQ